MEKLRTIFVEADIILLGVMVVVLLITLVRQQNVAEYTQGKLKRENRRLEIEIQQHDYLFGKYADSISDAMLQDFYPEADNLDYLRNHLKERYEIRLRNDTDGLCY